MKRGLIAFAFLAVLITLLVIYWLPPPSGAPPAVAPTPNAFVELMKVGRLVVDVPNDIDQADAATLTAFLDSNRESLSSIKVALQYESLVPIEYSSNFATQSYKQIEPVRQAARLLMAEAKLAELEGRINDAAQANLDLIALSQKATRGGLVIHFLLGTAYERVAWNSLLRIANSLTAEQRRQFLDELESLSYQREPLDAFADRERKLAIAANGRWMTFITRRQAGQAIDRCATLDEEMKQLKNSVIEAMRQP